MSKQRSTAVAAPRELPQKHPGGTSLSLWPRAWLPKPSLTTPIAGRSGRATQPSQKRFALSLPELLAALAILALLAALIIPRVVSHVDEARQNTCHTNQSDVELQAQLWRRDHGSFPAADLSDIGADTVYFPEGVPVCPVDGTSYTIDTTTGYVTGHDH